MDQSIEEIFIPLHYLCPWWPGARILTGLRLKFVTEGRIPVLKFGDTLLDPDIVWKEGVQPSRPTPGILLRTGDSPAVLANAYARDLRDLMNHVFPETYSDFGSVRVFPLQFRLEDFVQRPGGRLDFGWANYLSSAAVEHLGRDVVLKTPAHAIEELKGGTVLIQLHEEVILKDEPDPPWYQPIGYLERTTGVKCHVEYAFRPDLF